MRFGYLILAVLVVCGFLFWKDIKSGVKGISTTEKNQSEKPMDGISEVQIIERWDLPAQLKEVSGIALVDESRFACIQDEEGKIFIYNFIDKKIEKEIPFADAGDYEDVAIVGSTAWVLRADGKLFEVPMTGDKVSGKEYNTTLTAEQNVEGLAYDEKGKRLLLAIKDDEPGNKNYKGIYAFDLTSRQFNGTPVFRIDITNELLQTNDGKKKTIKPSAVGVHPTTGDIYLTDGPKSRLLIMNANGDVKQWISLGKEFEQPEGIAFNTDGDLYISNEGSNGPGNIMKVKVDASQNK